MPTQKLVCVGGRFAKFKPMLAERLLVGKYAHVLDGSHVFLAETKYDGERILAHVTRGPLSRPAFLGPAFPGQPSRASLPGPASISSAKYFSLKATTRRRGLLPPKILS